MLLRLKRRLGIFGAHNLRVLALTLLSLAGHQAIGAEIAAGLSTIDEGDDRPRAGALLHVGFSDLYRARLHVYGRDFGPVSERTYLLSGVRHFTPFKSPLLKAAAGVAIMNEQTDLTYGTGQGQNVAENNFNLGGVFGLSLQMPRGPMYLSLDWDAHVFPAGAAGIFLATGRKQTISITMGVALR